MPPQSQSDSNDRNDSVYAPIKPSSKDEHVITGKSSNSGINKKAIDETVAQDEEDAAAVAVLPWYRRGGMEVNMVGMAFNISLPVIILLRSASEEWVKAFATVWAICIVFSVLPPCNMRTTYCIVVVPTFVVSLSLAFTLIQDESWVETVKGAVVALVCSLIIAIFKVNICMSVCLHRYAAHHAFRCSNAMSVVIKLIGCLANQGGPIWWASQHRCHHKYCDLPTDPHSPILMGIENAFGFFDIYQAVNEPFAPRHLESPFTRLLDTWSFLVVSLELFTAFTYMGRFGLFLAYTSGWICQSITLWFNIVNHPPNNDISSSASTSIKDKCHASDDAPMKLKSYYAPFYLLNFLHPIFATFVMESEHKHHHDHAQLAKRSWYDIAYWGFVKPLEIAGLVYDVQV